MRERITLQEALAVWSQQRTPREGSSQHIPPAQLYELLIAPPEDGTRDRLFPHLIRCASCLQELQEMAESLEEAEHLHSHAEATRPTLRDHLSGLVQWLSPLWDPPLAGEVVTAAAMPPQEHVFYPDEGSVQVTCVWWAASPAHPAGLRLAWRANLTRVGAFWVRFTRRDDATAVLAEMPLPLGEALAGEHVWSAQDLGFDPSGEPWAIALRQETER